MTNGIIPSSSNEGFEGIKKIDENGVEYWLARELMPILGYEKWEKAEGVIGRAARACINSGQDVDNHFHRTGKMVKIGSNTVREGQKKSVPPEADKQAPLFTSDHFDKEIR